MTSFGRIGVTDFTNNVREMDLFRLNQRKQAEVHDIRVQLRDQAPDIQRHALEFRQRYDRPSLEALKTDRSRSSIQYHMRNVPQSQKTHTITTSQRKNAFMMAIQNLNGAPTSDSESPYPYKNTQLEIKHGDEIGSKEQPPTPNATRIVFTVEPVSGIPGTVQLKIQSPRNEPLVLKYGRADGYHHPMSREVTNEAYIDGVPDGEYVFIVGYPTVSARVHTINLNDPFTRLDYNSVPPEDHRLPRTAAPATRVHRVGAVRRW